MPHKPRQFVNGELYHIVLRRIMDEELFIDIDDHYRGIFSIYEFNNSKSVSIRKRRKERVRFKKQIKAGRGQTSVNNFIGSIFLENNEDNSPIEVRPRSVKSSFSSFVDLRDKFVDVLLFCLMPNHIHLFLRQLKDNGISKYMQKTGNGLASYFRNKYDLKLRGHFFQDRFTAVHVETDRQLIALFAYIHTNPLSLIEPEWKKKGIKFLEKAIKFLEDEYRWSSYFDYIGKKNFPSVTERDFLLEVIGGPEECKKIVNDWVINKAKMREEFEKFPNILLE